MLVECPENCLPVTIDGIIYIDDDRYLDIFKYDGQKSVKLMTWKECDDFISNPDNQCEFGYADDSNTYVRAKFADAPARELWKIKRKIKKLYKEKNIIIIE